MTHSATRAYSKTGGYTSAKIDNTNSNHPATNTPRDFLPVLKEYLVITFTVTSPLSRWRILKRNVIVVQFLRQDAGE